MPRHSHGHRRGQGRNSQRRWASSQIMTWGSLIRGFVFEYAAVCRNRESLALLIIEESGGVVLRLSPGEKRSWDSVFLCLAMDFAHRVAWLSSSTAMRSLRVRLLNSPLSKPTSVFPVPVGSSNAKSLDSKVCSGI